MIFKPCIKPRNIKLMNHMKKGGPMISARLIRLVYLELKTSYFKTFT